MMTGAKAVADGWMWTRSGLLVQPYNLNPSHVRLEDIAHSLAMQCRFCGHTRRHYSIAEHSLLVSQFAGFQGLHHDDSEAYLTDQPSPIKHRLTGYAEAEESCMRAIGAGLGVRLTPHNPLVKWADHQMLLVEIDELLPSRTPVEMGECEFSRYQRARVIDAMRRYEEMPPHKIRDAWLQRHAELLPVHQSTRP